MKASQGPAVEYGLVGAVAYDGNILYRFSGKDPQGHLTSLFALVNTRGDDAADNPLAKIKTLRTVHRHRRPAGNQARRFGGRGLVNGTVGMEGQQVDQVAGA
jgi:hypothetical protein